MSKATVIHIGLVSQNLAPNVIPALMMRPERFLMLVSEEMKDNANHLKRILENNGIAVTHYPKTLPNHDYAELLDFALGVLTETEAQASSLVMNVTGGNKLMSLAFVEAFRATEQADIIYVDTANQAIEFLGQPPKKPQPLSSVVSIDTCLALHQRKLRQVVSSEQAWLDTAQSRKALVKKMAHPDNHYVQVAGIINYAASGARPEPQRGNKAAKAFSPVQPVDYIKPRLAQWADTLSQASLMEADRQRNQLIFHSEEATGFLCGGWLEEYVYWCGVDAGLYDVGMSVEFTDTYGKRSTARNEFDVMMMHNNRALIVECKTASMKGSNQDIVNKLSAVAESAGGIFADKLLVSLNDIGPEAHQRCLLHHIIPIIGAQLSILPELLACWRDGGDDDEMRALLTSKPSSQR